jgi:NAD(P)-dependent dehydrogenase (short-subunit alcohol dehydrogenase family)
MALGGRVVLADLASQEGKAAAQVEAACYSSQDVVFVPVDTRRVEDLERCAQVAAQLGSLTCWFNNAGFAMPTDNVASIKANGLAPELRNMLEVNTLAHINGSGVAMRAFGPDGGVVVSTASMAGILPLGAPPVYSASKAAVVHFTRAMGLTLGEESNVRFYCLCPSYTATAQGPPTEQIKASVGGVLRAEHMGEGFIMLATQRPPNGSIMRVTARRGGTQVVHDIIVYGKELGGEERARDGLVMKSAALEPMEEDEMQKMNRVNEAGRNHEGMAVAKL